MIKLYWSLLLALPDLVKLIRELKELYDKEQEAKELKKDIQEIREAFRTRDADRLNRLFNKSNGTTGP